MTVIIPELNNEVWHYCESGKIDFSLCPKGKEFEVFYTQKKILGANFVEARLVENPPKNNLGVAIFIKYLGIVFLVIAVVTMLIGIIA